MNTNDEIHKLPDIAINIIENKAASRKLRMGWRIMPTSTETHYFVASDRVEPRSIMHRRIFEPATFVDEADVVVDECACIVVAVADGRATLIVEGRIEHVLLDVVRMP
jgi:hypothetical protein